MGSIISAHGDGRQGIWEIKWKKIRSIVIFALVIVVGAAVNGLAAGSIEWSVLKMLKLEMSPIDVAITPDGRRIFVLTEQGEILI